MNYENSKGCKHFLQPACNFHIPSEMPLKNVADMLLTVIYTVWI